LELQQLEKILDKDQIFIPETKAVYSFNHKELQDLLPVVYPQTIEQLAEILKLATAQKWSVIPVGGGTKLKIGNLPRKANLFLSTLRLNRVLEHEAADLTTTVEAGCNFVEFQKHLGQHSQYLPLDPPFQNATIGGVIATNSYGPTRLGNATVRDWLIGIKVVGADGQISKAGGKVVKNVAGYDLMKLYTGSFGTLCVIVQASFKLRPKPVKEALVLGVFDFEDLDNVARSLLASQLQPTALELLNSNSASFCFPEIGLKKGKWLVVSRFVGSEIAINYQVEAISQLWKNIAREISVIPQSDNASILEWDRIVNFSEKRNLIGVENRIIESKRVSQIRIAVLPSQTTELVSETEKILTDGINEIELIAHLGNGIIDIYFSLEQADKLDKLIEKIAELRALCESVGGHLILMDDTFQTLIDSWGTPPESIDLMKVIKQKLDPLEILNPGRFVGGI
jgi:glycolate oxidase FAD binding subunit